MVLKATKNQKKILFHFWDFYLNPWPLQRERYPDIILHLKIAVFISKPSEGYFDLENEADSSFLVFRFL